MKRLVSMWDYEQVRKRLDLIDDASQSYQYRFIVTRELEKLAKTDGKRYKLSYLEERLCRYRYKKYCQEVF